MSIDTSKILDDFNPNQRSDKGRGGGNPLFKKNSDRDSFGGNDRGRGAIGRYGGSIQRGGGGGERFSNDRGGRQYINNNDRFRNDSGGFNPGREQNNYNPREEIFIIEKEDMDMEEEKEILGEEEMDLEEEEEILEEEGMDLEEEEETLGEEGMVLEEGEEDLDFLEIMMTVEEIMKK